MLRRADLVLYDKLVPVALLEYAPAEAERVCVTDLGPCHVQRHAPIIDRMLAAARAGKRVVRLKGGDPYVFGRGGEEAEAMHHAGILFEVVPGVTAALGTAAYAGIPLTHRAISSAVAFVTGHENPEKPESNLDWNALARFPGTLVFYMGISRLERIAGSLIANGLSPDTPAAAVHAATTGQQLTVTAPLAALPARPRRGPRVARPGGRRSGGCAARADELVRAPSALRQARAHHAATAPGRPAGAATRRAWGAAVPAADSRSTAARRLGPGRSRPGRAVALRLGGVHQRQRRHGIRGAAASASSRPAALGGVRLAAIGPKTAEALRQHHLEPDLVPARYQSEDLAAALREHVRPGERVLLARADRGRELLREELAAVCMVEQIAVYSQVDAVDLDEEVLDHLRRGEIDYVTLTSANIARSLLGRLDATCRARIEAGEVRLVSISPVTSAEVGRLGLPIAAEAAEATAEGLVDAMTMLVHGVP